MKHLLTESRIDEVTCMKLVEACAPLLTPAKVGVLPRRYVDPRARLAYNVKCEKKYAPIPWELAEELKTAGASDVEQISGQRPVVTEPVEVVMYPPGGSFIRHHDGTHRPYSSICVLDNGFEGGELAFPTANLAFMLSEYPVGTMLTWENSPDASHESLQIAQGLKWIAVLWTAQTPEESSDGKEETQTVQQEHGAEIHR